MIDANYYLNMTKEDFLNFMKLTEILPIDDKLLYNGHIYQLTNFDIQTLNLTRNSLGYPNEYSGPEKNPGDAYKINMMDSTKIRAYAESIQYELDNKQELHRKLIK